MDVVEAIQFLALKAVIAEDGDFLMRRIARWYSVTFHTPLHLVEELPNEYILTHFFEYSFDKMEKRQRNKILRQLTETAQEKKEREEQEKKEKGISDEEYLAKVQKEMARKAKKRKEKAQKAVSDMKKDSERDALSPSAVAAVIRDALPGVPTPPIDQLPNIEMSFDSNLDDVDALSIPTTKKKS